MGSATAGPGRRLRRTAARSSCRSAAGWTSTTGGSSIWASARAPAPASPGAGDAPEVAGTLRTTGRIKAQGTVTNSVFAHNHFGAYTHQAQGMRWSGNTFSDNVEYGFDPHDFSNDFVVESNTAHHNGKHGFIFSRGCVGNVLRGNTAYANVGHGFMIDDGRSAASATAEARHHPLERQPRHRQPRLRQRRQRRRDRGRHRQRRVGQPPVAQRHRGARQVRATASVTGNVIDGSVRYGVHVLDPAARVAIDGNRISGSWAAVNLAAASSATLGENPSTDVSTPLVIGGVAQRDPSWTDRVGQFLRWNPVLVLWALTLGVPLLIGLSAVRARAPSPDAATDGDDMTKPHRGGCREPWCCWPGWSCCSPAAPPRPGRTRRETMRPAGLPEIARLPWPANLPAADPVHCPAATVEVSTSAQLQTALRDAVPGTVIDLADGTYDGTFTAAASGTAAAPIWICGGRDAVLRGPGTDEGFVLYLRAGPVLAAGRVHRPRGPEGRHGRRHETPSSKTSPSPRSATRRSTCAPTAPTTSCAGSPSPTPACAGSSSARASTWAAR